MDFSKFGVESNPSTSLTGTANTSYDYIGVLTLKYMLDSPHRSISSYSEEGARWNL